MRIMANLRKCSNNYVKQGVCAIFGSTSTACHVCDLTDVRMHPPLRTFSRTSQLAKSRNFYDDLGIQKTATQSEIKSAYYNLSMVLHPDKNKGNEVASKRFRIVSEAYEVLGNFRTRRMYDKGIGSYGRASPTTESPGVETEIIHEEIEDDAQTKFYKQHMVKSQPPEMSDRMTARDFDNWASNKITQSFQHQQYIKRMVKNREEDERQMTTRGEQYGYLIVICTLVICMNIYYQYEHNRQHDVVLSKKGREKNS
ncbi:dnaJ homolog subfamily C member 4 [Sitodiplosis mosellana]|uniref:dnaJ homolog subfamily C member 4 n=1 Tax=Sitodiplosis mosellana TaxID=263140 RepID=UPI002444F0CC|nr:dnaJ homolog subfamily C member 4 [Sitodiplosis mosellana]